MKLSLLVFSLLLSIGVLTSQSLAQPEIFSCSPGELRCNGDNIEACSPGGSAWILREICAYGCENNACSDVPEAASLPEPELIYTPIPTVTIVAAAVAIVIYYLYTRKKNSR